MKKLFWLLIICGAAAATIRFFASAKSRLPQANAIAGSNTDTLVWNNLHVDAASFLDAALQAEAQNNRPFDSAVYELGAHLNELVEQSLALTPAARAELDRLLQENYPEIASEARLQYLSGISELKEDTVKTLASTKYATRADILAAAINSMACSFSTLVFIPLKLRVSLPTTVAASYFFQQPCESILSAISNKVASQIESRGLVKDIEQTQINFRQQEKSSLAELGAARLKFSVDCAKSIKRSVGTGRWTLATWDAAALNIQYEATITYGFDLTTGFSMELKKDGHTFSVILPQPGLIGLELEPILTEFEDGGIPDLDNEDFKDLYDTASEKAILIAKRKGIEEQARTQAKEVYKTILSPMLSNGKQTYQLEFRFISLNL